MNRSGKAFLVVMAALLLANPVIFAKIPEKYQTIVDRNAFGLNPPVILPPEEKVVTPPANVKLTGFTKMNGQKRAYFVIQPKDPKDQPLYVNLPEGARDGILEIVKISDDEGEVRVKNSGVDMVLSLKNNGFKPAATAPAPAAAAAPVSPVYNPANSAAVANFNPKPANPLPPGAPQPSVGYGIGQQRPEPGTQLQNANPPAGGGLRTIPTRTLRLPPPQQGNPQSSVVNPANDVVFRPSHAFTPTATPQNEAQVDPAAQYLGMLAQHEEEKRKGRNPPPVPPMPP